MSRAPGRRARAELMASAPKSMAPMPPAAFGEEPGHAPGRQLGNLTIHCGSGLPPDSTMARQGSDVHGQWRVRRAARGDERRTTPYPIVLLSSCRRDSVRLLQSRAGAMRSCDAFARPRTQPSSRSGMPMGRAERPLVEARLARTTGAPAQPARPALDGRKPSRRPELVCGPSPSRAPLGPRSGAARASLGRRSGQCADDPRPTRDRSGVYPRTRPQIGCEVSPHLQAEASRCDPGAGPCYRYRSL